MEKNNPEYEKYHNIVLEFKDYMNNAGITNPEGKKTMYSFLKHAYGLEPQEALIEMRKVENIVYADKQSTKPTRNRRRERRKAFFNEELNIK